MNLIIDKINQNLNKQILTFRVCLLKLFLFLLLFQLNAFAFTSEKTIKNFNTQLCSNDNNKCIELNSKIATPSNFKSIFFLKDISIKFIITKHSTSKSTQTKPINENDQTKSYNQFFYNMGFLDLSNNQLTLIDKINGQTIETVYALSTLQPKVYR